MLTDALKGYVGSAAGRVAALTDDIVATSRSNRSTLVTLIRYEIDRALSGLGLANATDIAELTGRVRALEAAVRTLRADVARLTDASHEPEQASS